MLQDVAKVGRKGQMVTVADGFALNALLPSKKAVIATPDAVKRYEAAERDKAAQGAAAAERLAAGLRDIDGKSITILERASDKGHLFAKIAVAEVVEAVKAQLGVTIDASVLQGFSPVKEVGSFPVKLMAAGQKATVTLEVKAK